MKNRLAALFAALLLSGAFYLLLAGLVDRGWPLDDVLLLAVAATLTLSVLAGALAYRAWLRSLQTRGEFQRLAVSVDTAFRDLARQANGDVFTLVDVNEHVSREIERLAERLRADHLAARHAMPEANPRGSTIVPLPATRRNRREPAGSAPAIDIVKGQAIRRVIASGQVDLSLQPIIAIARGAAMGFDVYAHLDLDDGRSVDLRGAAGLVRDSELAAFERSLVLSAAHSASASRRSRRDHAAARRHLRRSFRK